MRHIKGIGFCRTYGDEKTHLTLTQKAEAVYAGTDPLRIYEKELVDTERECEPEYRYFIRGAFEVDDINEFAVNKFLEELGEETI